MALGTAGALVAASAVGTAGSAIAAKKGADATTQAAANSDAVQERIYLDQKETAQPWIDVGENALAMRAFINGIGPAPGAVQNALASSEIVETPAQPIYTETQVENPNWGGPLHGVGANRYITRQEQTGTTPASFAVDGQTFGSRDAAANHLASLSGGTQATQDNPLAALRATPGYQFQLAEGNQALQRSAAARGMLNSGAFAKDAMRFGQGMADQTFTNWDNRLASMAGQGQAQVNQIGAVGSNYAANVGQNALAAGQAKSSGYMDMSNAFNSGINNYMGITGMRAAGAFQ